MTHSRSPLIANPTLRDRLKAFAVFTGIAIGGVAGVEMVIGGGFDTITPAFAFEASAPRTWYDRPIEPGMGWLSEPYAPAAATLTVSQQFDDGYPIDAHYQTTNEELDGGPRGETGGFSYAMADYEPTSSEGDALVSAADGPLDDAMLNDIVSDAEAYVDEINALYAEGHAAEAVARETPPDMDPKLSGNASPS
jgi:hypothetical protein